MKYLRCLLSKSRICCEYVVVYDHIYVPMQRNVELYFTYNVSQAPEHQTVRLKAFLHVC